MVTCPKCGGEFASPHDLDTHKKKIAPAIWNGGSQCDYIALVRAEAAKFNPKKENR